MSAGRNGAPGLNGETPMQRDRAVTIFERSRPGRRAGTVPETDVPQRSPDELIPAHLRRESPAGLPEVSEPEIVRHYNRLSRRNFDVDTGLYPLGSCTMKHNPRLNERVAALAGHARLHPAQHPRRAQGALELMWLLERALAEICGLPHTSLQPSAGSPRRRFLGIRSEIGVSGTSLLNSAAARRPSTERSKIVVARSR